MAAGEPARGRPRHPAADPERPLRRGRRPVHAAPGDLRVPAAAGRAAVDRRARGRLRPLPRARSRSCARSSCPAAPPARPTSTSRRRSSAGPSGTPGPPSTPTATSRGQAKGEGGVNVLTAKYLNRLSDLLFVLARVANLPIGGDVLWQPGGGRAPAPEKTTGAQRRRRPRGTCCGGLTFPVPPGRRHSGDVDVEPWRCALEPAAHGGVCRGREGQLERVGAVVAGRPPPRRGDRR